MKQTVLTLTTVLGLAHVLQATEPIIGNLGLESSEYAYSPAENRFFAAQFTTGPAAYDLQQVSLQILNHTPGALWVRLLSSQYEVLADFATQRVEGSGTSVLVHFSGSGPTELDPFTSYFIAVGHVIVVSPPPAMHVTSLSGYDLFARESGWTIDGDFTSGVDSSGNVRLDTAWWGHLKIQLSGIAFNTPPDVSRATASIPVLWPPNGKMTPFQILGVTDPDGDAISLAVTGIRQDEPVSAQGDAVILADGSAMVRADRSNSGNGRVYTIEFQASDGNGGVSPGVVKIPVPRDFNRAAVDEGPIYTSTQPSGPSLLKAR